MFKKLFQIIAIAMFAVVISDTVLAQEEKEISLGRNRTIEINRSGNYRLSNDVWVESGKDRQRRRWSDP